MLNKRAVLVQPFCPVYSRIGLAGPGESFASIDSAASETWDFQLNSAATTSHRAVDDRVPWPVSGQTEPRCTSFI